jgi:hypothetical protein
MRRSLIGKRMPAKRNYNRRVSYVGSLSSVTKKLSKTPIIKAPIAVIKEKENKIEVQTIMNLKTQEIFALSFDDFRSFILTINTKSLRKKMCMRISTMILIDFKTKIA